jgi:hypothetical protein
MYHAHCRRRGFAAALLALAFVAAPAYADWNPGDAHKMHFPQMPDPTGFDVNFRSPLILADDWRCSETGPVEDIHFWFSARNDWLDLTQQLDTQIYNIHVSIHANVPAGPVVPYSRPGALLWERDYNVGQVKIREYGAGPQAWYDPATGVVVPNDHNKIFQCNIKDIVEPFYQKKNTIYWLDISVSSLNELGWKSSDRGQYPPPYTGQHFEDDAVWSTPAIGWQEIHYPGGPFQGQSMDLAFVITGSATTWHHKMHFPQNPDPTGADVYFNPPRVLADDWRCSESGPVNDIHFWFSAYHDWLDLSQPLPQQIFNIHVSIHADIPDPDGQGPEYSRPGPLLWQRDYPVDAATRITRCYTEGQSWYNPSQGQFEPLNHQILYRCDITDIVDPFIQEIGHVYWLDVWMSSEGPLGWKTADLDQYPTGFTGNHFLDDGVWGDLPNPFWQELRWPPGTPNSGQSIDLAFVITRPTPTEVGRDVPEQYYLEQNYPNPFNPTTTIRYSLPARSSVELAVFSVDGRLVRVLETGTKPMGTYEAVWDGHDASGAPVASGVYFYRLNAGSFSETRKMVLMK